MLYNPGPACNPTPGKALLPRQRSRRRTTAWHSGSPGWRAFRFTLGGSDNVHRTMCQANSAPAAHLTLGVHWNETMLLAADTYALHCLAVHRGQRLVDGPEPALKAQADREQTYRPSVAELCCTNGGSQPCATRPRPSDSGAAEARGAGGAAGPGRRGAPGARWRGAARRGRGPWWPAGRTCGRPGPPRPGPPRRTPRPWRPASPRPGPRTAPPWPPPARRPARGGQWGRSTGGGWLRGCRAGGRRWRWAASEPGPGRVQVSTASGDRVARSWAGVSGSLPLLAFGRPERCANTSPGKPAVDR